MVEEEKWLILIIHRSRICELANPPKRIATNPTSTARSVLAAQELVRGVKNLGRPVGTLPGETEQGSALPSPSTLVSRVL